MQSYSTYVAVVYVLSALILVCLATTGWVAVALKKDDSSGGWLQKYAIPQGAAPATVLASLVLLEAHSECKVVGSTTCCYMCVCAVQCITLLFTSSAIGKPH